MTNLLRRLFQGRDLHEAREHARMDRDDDRRETARDLERLRERQAHIFARLDVLRAESDVLARRRYEGR